MAVHMHVVPAELNNYITVLQKAGYNYIITTITVSKLLYERDVQAGAC